MMKKETAFLSRSMGELTIYPTEPPSDRFARLNAFPPNACLYQSFSFEVGANPKSGGTFLKLDFLL
jgi:hypothetical protein